VESVVLQSLGHVLLHDAVLFEGAQVQDELKYRERRGKKLKRGR
jgi:hypothetical protein